ncbi:hypothetical protein BJ684DRAFT_18344 [Piptocephalis cylindrospora]|uniref:Uncharacterized protein n=1 Tax=Piptocephalis cylindrospora TaxID=1907219 RepID=A0A4P9Y841_9FUNG|nr:hypothetical protein BJ684DRAFT_18344 [Piptocephalis cylindrospora]|eukprot:RKP15327.1 hypothetical protein BJ684DRAFT_18344 [Piptocephalis cylindrospora]
MQLSISLAALLLALPACLSLPFSDGPSRTILEWGDYRSFVTQYVDQQNKTTLYFLCAGGGGSPIAVLRRTGAPEPGCVYQVDTRTENAGVKDTENVSTTVKSLSLSNTLYLKDTNGMDYFKPSPESILSTDFTTIGLGMKNASGAWWLSGLAEASLPDIQGAQKIMKTSNFSVTALHPDGSVEARILQGATATEKDSQRAVLLPGDNPEKLPSEWYSVSWGSTNPAPATTAVPDLDSIYAGEAANSKATGVLPADKVSKASSNGSSEDTQDTNDE